MAVFTSVVIVLSVYLAAIESLSLPIGAQRAKQGILDLVNGPENSKPDIFVCPETLSPLKMVHRYYGFSEDVFYQNTDDKDLKYQVYPGRYIDLTIKSDVDRPLWELTGKERFGQNFFQIPLVSAVYERGYRQQFETAGFPGIDKEFAEINEFFSAGKASTILDLSCGSGFMTRRLAKSGNYARVIAADLSPTMLAETRRRCREEGIKVPELVRCDASRLPFATGSLDAVHAGAAMHCWPRLTETLAEIHRVLKPGGLFFATTFFVNFSDLAQLQRRQQSGFFFFESAEEIGDYTGKGGFTGAGGATVVRREGRACAIIKAMKAPLPVSKGEGDDGSDEDLLFDLFGKKKAEQEVVVTATAVEAPPPTAADVISSEEKGKETEKKEDGKDNNVDTAASRDANDVSAPSTD